MLIAELTAIRCDLPTCDLQTDMAQQVLARYPFPEAQLPSSGCPEPLQICRYILTAGYLPNLLLPVIGKKEGTTRNGLIIRMPLINVKESQLNMLRE